MNGPDEMTATLPPAEWDLIGAALSQLPYGQVANLMSKLQSQLAAQRVPPTTEKKDE